LVGCGIFSDFLNNHFRKWIPDFRKALGENAQLSVYNQLGKMLILLE